MARSGVQLAGIRKEFAGTQVIEEISLAIEAGELLVIVGPSGCGKSTLLRMIAGLDAPSAGTIHIGARDVTSLHPARRGVAMVFQSYALYPHMSVQENLAFGLKMQRLPQPEIRARVAKAVEILQLEPLLKRKPRALSGGQRQRVAIGRAIVREPEVFLFDEPLSNLDAALRGQMRTEIARLHARLGTTMIYVTHDQVEAMTLASRIVVLNSGRIEQVGAPLELYRRPANLFVAGFIGAPRMNLLPCRARSRGETSAELALAGSVLEIAHHGARIETGEPMTLGVRPEHLSIVAAGERDAGESRTAIAGHVSLVERLGGESVVHVRLDSQAEEMMVAKVAGDAPFAVNQRVLLQLPSPACHLFDSRGRALRAAGCA